LFSSLVLATSTFVLFVVSPNPMHPSFCFYDVLLCPLSIHFKKHKSSSAASLPHRLQFPTIFRRTTRRLATVMLFFLWLDTSDACEQPKYHILLFSCRFKRSRELGKSKEVLMKASPRCLSVRADKWSEDAHKLVRSCADAGNLDASYILGMVNHVNECVDLALSHLFPGAIQTLSSAPYIYGFCSTACVAAGQALLP
jgi:hypothetical protein